MGSAEVKGAELEAEIHPTDAWEIDASAWRNTEGDWQTALNVSNVTDKLYYLTLFDLHGSAGYVNGQPAMPRQYSISVKHTF